MFWFGLVIGIIVGGFAMALCAIASKSERDASKYYDQTPGHRPRVGSLHQYRSKK